MTLYNLQKFKIETESDEYWRSQHCMSDGILVKLYLSNLLN